MPIPRTGSRLWTPGYSRSFPDPGNSRLRSPFRALVAAGGGGGGAPTSPTPGSLWVSMAGADEIRRYALSDLTQEDSINTDTVAGHETAPRGLCFDGEGFLWFSDDAGIDLHKVDISGPTLEATLSTPGSDPWGVAFDAFGNLWHTDTNGTIYKLDPSDGSTINSWTAPGTGTLRYIAVGPDGNLWISRISANTIYNLDISDPTVVLDSFSTPGSDPNGLAFDANGALFHADGISSTVYELDREDGSQVDTYGVSQPEDVAA